MNKLFKIIEEEWSKTSGMNIKLKTEMALQLGERCYELYEELQGVLHVDEYDLTRKILNTYLKSYLCKVSKAKKFTAFLEKLNGDVLVKSISDDYFSKAYADLLNTKGKSHYDLLRRYAGEIQNLHATGRIKDSGSLSLMVKIMTEAANSFPRFKKFFHKFIADLYYSDKSKTRKILKKYDYKHNDPEVFLCDQIYVQTILAALSRKDLGTITQLINQNKCFAFKSYGENKNEILNVQIRLVEDFIPVLTKREYNCLADATEMMSLEFNTTLCLFGAFSYLDWGQKINVIPIAPGNYSICAYLYHVENKKYVGHYIVLSSSEKKASSTIQVIPEFNRPLTD